MKDFKKDLITIYQTERWMLILMIINIVLSIGLLIFSIINLNSGSSVIRIGYGDIDGYRSGSIIDLLAFPVLAIIFGFLHSLLAIKIFHQRGGGMAKFFLILTTALILGTFLVFTKIIGEG